MSKKPVIVFEGIEGSGKSFHSSFVSRYLKKKKIKHIKIREPGGTINAEKIRNLILDKKSLFKKKTDLLLYLASRSENVEYLRRYHKKQVILIDRFIDSTLAYQHYGMGLDFKMINQINKYLMGSFGVDFTFLNIVSIANMQSRLRKRKKLNRYDNFDVNFYLKVQKGFLKIAKKNIKKYKIIDSNKEIEINQKIIIEKINRLLKI